ncbi:FGGY-family carbohydrate kinase [Benzoatithermus flavus]|uniref:FGGY family carbohydrate kinase n=1 Tax=Benzoatithermus flavus TaxID=3108223 RepID=A0ABU8XW00_9PROT
MAIVGPRRQSRESVDGPNRTGNGQGVTVMATDRPLLCGIDAGTSQIRAILFATDGRVVAHAAEPTPMRELGPGRAELDPEALWRITVSLLRRVAAEAPDAAAIRSIAVASVGEAGVLLDADGRPLAPVMAWYDTRATAELEQLLATIGFEQLHRITGLCPDPTFSLLKLLWLKRHEPELFARARRWLNVADYLAWRLSGEQATDPSLASRTLLLDLERRTWAASLLEATGLPASLLAPILPGGSPLGRIRPELAGATSLPDDCVVGVGGHDHVCGMLAAGADRPGILFDSMGTAEALTCIREAPLADPALGWDGFNQGAIELDRPFYYVFGGLPTAAAAVEWFRSVHGGLDHATLIAEAEAAPGDSDGVLFLPHLRLGSPPFPDPVGRGAFVGLSASTTRGALFRAVLEGIALDGANILGTMLRHLGARMPERILCVGGSTRNQLLMRLKATAYGVPLAVLDLPDATCLGAALLGGIAAGIHADLAEARSRLEIPVRLVHPDSNGDEGTRLGRQAIYATAYATLRPLHARLLDR